MAFWRYKLHPTWHFTAWCGAVIFGLLLGFQDWAGSLADWSWMILGVLLLVPAVFYGQRWLLILAILGGFLLGISRSSSDFAQQNILSEFHGSDVSVVGVVSEDLDIGKSGKPTLRLKDLQISQRRFSGELWVSLANHAKIRRSDTIQISGKMRSGFGSFSGAMYRAKLENVWPTSSGDIMLNLRDDFGKKVRQFIDEPAASLGMGFIAGQRRGLPEQLGQALRIAGLVHVVVASGYNLTILVRFVRRLLAKISRFQTVFVAGLLVIGFIGVTGLSPSMMRAGLVAGMALVAWYFGRKFHPATMILIAAALTGLAKPSYVWGNLGWQLSFLSFAGVMILAPLLQNYFFGAKKPGNIRQIIGETFSAQIMTIPLIMYAFGTLSTVSLLANVLVLPLIPLAMLLVFLTGLAAYVLGPLAALLAWPSQKLLDYMVMVATELSSFEWSYLEVDIGLGWLLAMYAGLLAVALYLKRATKLNLRDSSIIE